MRGTPEQRRLRDAPPAPDGKPHYQIVAPGLGPLPVPVIVAIFVAAGLMMAGVYFLTTRHSAAEVWDRIS